MLVFHKLGFGVHEKCEHVAMLNSKRATKLWQCIINCFQHTDNT